jgi:hypothetical protein
VMILALSGRPSARNSASSLRRVPPGPVMLTTASWASRGREQVAGGLLRGHASAERGLPPQRAWPLVGAASRRTAGNTGLSAICWSVASPDAHRRIPGSPYPVEPQSLQIHHLDWAGCRISVQPGTTAEHDGILASAQNCHCLFQARRAAVSTADVTFATLAGLASQLTGPNVLPGRPNGPVAAAGQDLRPYARHRPRRNVG